MNLFIYFCILALNVVAIFMTYKFLGASMEKKEKFIFIVIGMAVMYLTVSVVYWLSTKNLDIGELAEVGKKIITFTFVPVNSIIVLPFIASSYKHFKIGDLKSDNFRNRCILSIIVMILVLTVEFFYFKDIQLGILNIVTKS